jgi:hypothetical protein
MDCVLHSGGHDALWWPPPALLRAAIGKTVIDSLNVLIDRLTSPEKYALTRFGKTGQLSAGAGCAADLVQHGYAEWQSAHSWLIRPLPMGAAMAKELIKSGMKNG